MAYFDQFYGPTGASKPSPSSGGKSSTGSTFFDDFYDDEKRKKKYGEVKAETKPLPKTEKITEAPKETSFFDKVKDTTAKAGKVVSDFLFGEPETFMQQKAPNVEKLKSAGFTDKEINGLTLTSYQKLKESEDRILSLKENLSRQRLINEQVGKGAKVDKSQRMPVEIFSSKEREIKALEDEADIYRQLTGAASTNKGFFKRMVDMFDTPVETFQNLTPYVKNFVDSEENKRMLSIENKLKNDTPLSDEEKSYVKRRDAKVIQAYIDKGFGDVVAESIAPNTSYMVDFALTGGVYGTGKKAVEATLTKAPKIISSLAGGIVGSLLQGSVRIPVIAKNVSDYMLPRYDLVAGDKGTLLIKKLDEGDSFNKALAKGYASAIIETTSEHMGAIVEDGGDFVKKAILSRFGVLNKVASPKQLFDIAEKVGWNGIIPEVFEEYAQYFLQAPIDKTKIELPDPTRLVGRKDLETAMPDLFTQKAADQFLVTTVSVAMQGLMMNTTQGALNKALDAKTRGDRPVLDVDIKDDTKAEQGQEKPKSSIPSVITNEVEKRQELSSIVNNILTDQERTAVEMIKAGTSSKEIMKEVGDNAFGQAEKSLDGETGSVSYLLDTYANSKNDDIKSQAKTALDTYFKNNPESEQMTMYKEVMGDKTPSKLEITPDIKAEIEAIQRGKSEVPTNINEEAGVLTAKNDNVQENTTPTENIAESVLSYVDKDGKKVYTTITKDELSILKNETENIPDGNGKESQIHLDPLKDNIKGGAREVSREEFAANHSQVAGVLDNVKTMLEEGPTEEKGNSSVESKKDLLLNATIGKGEYKGGEIYYQDVGGTKRGVIIESVDNGGVRGYYLPTPSPSKILGNDATLEPVLFTKPSEELKVTKGTDAKIRELLKQRFFPNDNVEKPPAEEGRVVTPKDAAIKLIEAYVLRGDSLQSLKNGNGGTSNSEFSAQIGGYSRNGKNYSADNILVEKINGKEVNEVFSLKKIYDEIAATAKEPKVKQETTGEKYVPLTEINGDSYTVHTSKSIYIKQSLDKGTYIDTPYTTDGFLLELADIDVGKVRPPKRGEPSHKITTEAMRRVVETASDKEAIVLLPPSSYNKEKNAIVFENDSTKKAMDIDRYNYMVRKYPGLEIKTNMEKYNAPFFFYHEGKIVGFAAPFALREPDSFGDVPIKSINGEKATAPDRILAVEDNLSPSGDVEDDKKKYQNKLLNLFRGTNVKGDAIVSSAQLEFDRVLVVNEGQAQLLNTMIGSGIAVPQDVWEIEGSKPRWSVADPFIRDYYKKNYDAIVYENQDRPQLQGYEVHSLGTGDFYASNEQLAKLYAMQKRGAKYQKELQAPAEQVIIQSQTNEATNTGTNQLIGQEGVPDTSTVGEGRPINTPEVPRVVSEGVGGNTAISSTSTGDRPTARVATTIQEIIDQHASVDKVTGEVSIEMPINKEQEAILRAYTPAGGMEKQGADGRGLLDEYYTPKSVVDAMWNIIKKYVPLTKDTRILEPAAGIGAFIDSVNGVADVTALEINEETAKITQLLHPQSQVFNKQFETLFVTDRGSEKVIKEEYDVVVGNPPYGEHRGRYLGLGEEAKVKKYEEYFIKRGLDITKPDGVVAMLVPSGILRTTLSASKERIASLGELVLAYRFPNGIFDKTDIGTDLLVFRKKATSEDTEIYKRQNMMSNDNYFTINSNNVLGQQDTKRGRFGEEKVVTGSLDEAIDRLSRIAGIDVNVPIQEISTSTIVSSGTNPPTETFTDDPNVETKPRVKTEEAKKEVQRTIDKNVTIVSTKKSPPLSLSSVKPSEIAIWQNTVATGELSSEFVSSLKVTDTKLFENNDISVEFDNGKPKFYTNFMYEQGNIYEKLGSLERNKENMSDGQYQRQKKALEAILPVALDVNNIQLQPTSQLIDDIEITIVDEEPRKLKDMFVRWMRSLQRDAYEDSGSYEVEGYIDGSIVNSGDKELNIEIRKRRRRVGNKLFQRFVENELNDDQKAIVADKYNRSFNGFVRPDYRKIPLIGKVHSTFKKGKMSFRPLQIEGAAFLTTKGVGLLGYDTGVGKTLTGILAINEAMARGFTKRPLIIVPNGTYLDWMKNMMDVIPGVKINSLQNLGSKFKGDLTKFKVADGTISIMSYEGLRKLGFKQETYDRLLGDLQDTISGVGQTTERGKEKEKAKADEFIGEAMKKTTDQVFFEDLNFDHVTIDEVQNFKNIFVGAKLEKGKGNEYRNVHGSSSERGKKAYLLTQHILGENNGRNVHLLSATPFSNSPLEIYSILSLMAKKKLEDMGLKNVNEFMSMFMDLKPTYVVKADQSVMEEDVVDKYINLQQLQQIVTQYIDFRTGDDAGIYRPKKFKKKIVLHPTQNQLDMMKMAEELFAKKKDGGVIQGITELQNITLSPYLSRYARNGDGASTSKDDTNKKYYINKMTENGPKFFEVDGTPVVIEPWIETFLHKASQGGWAVSEATTGLYIGTGKTRADATERAKGIIGGGGKEYTLKRVQEKREGVGASPRVTGIAPVAAEGEEAEVKYLTLPYNYKSFVSESPKIRYAMDMIEQNKKDSGGAGQIIYMPRGVQFFSFLRQYLTLDLKYKANEVAIIQGGMSIDEKQAIQDGFNAGTIKILIGTEAIKEGVNIQENATDMYWLHLPWNPTDIKQGEGRVERFGNRWKSVRIHYPLIENSVDAFIFQKLETKEKRLKSVWSYKGGSLEIGDLDFEDMKLDLITDPVKRVEAERAFAKSVEGQRLAVMKSELSFLRGYVEKWDDAQADIKYAEARVEKAKTEQDTSDYVYYKKDLAKGKEKLARVSNIFTRIDTNIDQVKMDALAKEKQITEQQTKIDGLKDEFEAKIEKAKTVKRETRLLENDYKALVEEIKETNKEFFVKADMKAPSGTASMKNYAIDETTQSLLKEAKKYKTADEFVESQGETLYHTTPNEFDQFDRKYLGSNTNFDNAESGFFFADSLGQIEEFKAKLQEGFGGSFIEDGKKKTAEEIAKYRTIEKIVKKEEFFNFNYGKKDLTVKEAKDFIEFANEEMGGVYDFDGETIDTKNISEEKLPKLLKKYVFRKSIDPDEDFEAYFTENHLKDFVKYLEEKGYKGMISDFGKLKNEYLVFDPNSLKNKSQLIEIWKKSRATAPSGTASKSEYDTSLTPKEKTAEALVDERITLQSIEMPEMVALAREISGNTPLVKKLVGKQGDFTGPNRIRLSADIFKDPILAARVLAHEIGHLIDYIPEGTLSRGNILGRINSLQKFLKGVYGELNNKEVREELKALTMKWAPFDVNADEGYRKYRHSSKELYADAISVLFNDPEMLKRDAPVFWQGFFDNLEKKPDVKFELFETWNLLMKGEEALLNERDQNINEMFKRGDDIIIAKSVEQKAKKDDYWFKLKFDMVDRNQKVIDDIARAKKKGAQISDDHNPQYMLEEHNYVGGVVKAFVVENVQPIFKKVKEAGIEWTDFGKVLFLERVINERSELANPLGQTKDTAERQLIKLEQTIGSEKYAKLQTYIEQFRNNIKSVLDQAQESGFYSSDLVDELKANPSYATFQVLDYLDLHVDARVKQQIGTLKEIANPADSMIQKTISLIKAIERNKTKTTLITFYKENFSGEVVDAKYMWNGKTRVPVDTHERDLGLVTLYEKGKLRGYYVDKYIASTVNITTSGHVNAILGTLRFFNSKLYRPLFITFNTGFQTFNAVRDFTRFYKNVPNLPLWRAFLRYGQAVKPAFLDAINQPSAIIQEMEKLKMLSVTYNDVLSGKTEIDSQIDLIMSKYGSMTQKQKLNIFAPITAVFDLIEKTGNFIERLPKIAAYLELDGKLPSHELAQFIRTKAGSPDFLRRGNSYAWSNDVFLFSNSIKEGLRADLEVATDPKTRGGFWFKTAMINLLPKIIMFAAIQGFLGPVLKKMLESMSEYDRTNYITVPMGFDETGKLMYLRIPQDETGRFIASIFWKSLRMTNKDRDALKDAQEILSIGGGQFPSLTPSIGTMIALTQFAFGQNPYDFFRNRNVIPDQEFKAGGMYKLKPFATWMFGQLGGSVLLNTYVTEQMPSSKSWQQKVLELPIISNVMGRWIKVSDYGVYEKTREIELGVEQRKAQEGIENKAIITSAIKEYASGPKSLFRKQDIEKAMIVEILGHKPKTPEEKTKATNAIKKFRVAVVQGEYDTLVDRFFTAGSNEEKLIYLKEIKSSRSTEKYRALIKVLKKEKLISENLLKLMNKQK